LFRFTWSCHKSLSWEAKDWNRIKNNKISWNKLEQLNKKSTWETGTKFESW